MTINNVLAVINSALNIASKKPILSLERKDEDNLFFLENAIKVIKKHSEQELEVKLKKGKLTYVKENNKRYILYELPDDFLYLEEFCEVLHVPSYHIVDNKLYWNYKNMTTPQTINYWAMQQNFSDDFVEQCISELVTIYKEKYNKNNNYLEVKNG